MNRLAKIILLIVFHGLMMVDFHYWKLAKEHLLLASNMASSDAVITPMVEAEINRLGVVLLVNITMIAALVVWLWPAQEITQSRGLINKIFKLLYIL